MTASADSARASPLPRPRVAAGSVAAAIITTIVAGLMPALTLTWTRPGDALKRGGREMTRSGCWWHRAVVVAQFGLTLVLLVAAGLFGETFVKLGAQPLGFSSDGVVVASVLSDRPRPQAPLTPDQRDAIRQQMRGLSGGARSRAAQSGRWLPIGALLDRLSRLPGVTAAAATDAAPFTAAQSRTARVRAEGRPAAESQPVPWHFVSDRYFDALGMSVVRGRVFADGDRVAPDERVVISAGLERRVFGGEPAVGRTLRLGENPLDVVTVIGVVADIRQRAFTDEDRLAMYALVWRDSARHLVVRASGDISALLPAIRQTVEHDDARLVVTSVEPLDGVVARSIVVERSRALLSGAYGLAALLLASVGLYGLAAQLVAERRREIGIRVALGAGRRDVRRLVMIDAWLIVGVGLLIGVPSAIGLSRVAQGLLYDVAPTSPRTLILAAGTLAMAALASTLVPALRASRIDPAASLRED